MAFTPVTHNPTVFSTDKKQGGAYTLTSAAVTALGGLTTANTVSEVLDILSEVVKDSHVVGTNSIGKATSVDNS